MKKNLIISVTFVTAVLLLIFLGLYVFRSPMDIKITEKNYDAVVEKIRKNASKDDYEKVQAVILLAQLASTGENEAPIKIMEGKSFKEMIKKIKHNAEESEQKQELQKSVEKEKQKIRNTYIKSLEWNWEVAKDASNPYIKVLNVTMKAKNTKDVDIEAFEANIGMYDKLDNEIASIDVKCTKKLPKNAEADFNWTVSEMDNLDAVTAMSKENGDIYFEFKPTKLLVGGKEL